MTETTYTGLRIVKGREIGRSWVQTKSTQPVGRVVQVGHHLVDFGRTTTALPSESHTVEAVLASGVLAQILLRAKLEKTAPLP